jgi:hypothetical protein
MTMMATKEGKEWQKMQEVEANVLWKIYVTINLKITTSGVEGR